MASVSGRILRSPYRARSIAPDLFERVLALASAILLIAVLIAIARGHSQWDRLPWTVWVHLATIALALGLTPLMLLRRRGDRLHRRLGWLWAGSLAGTAIVSLFIRLSNSGHFSLIHLLSVWTLIQVPLIVWSARTHNVARHRTAVRGMVLGALLIAGFFTFPFGRLLGQWLLG